jgi:hypothetical protein
MALVDEVARLFALANWMSNCKLFFHSMLQRAERGFALFSVKRVVPPVLPKRCLVRALPLSDFRLPSFVASCAPV